MCDENSLNNCLGLVDIRNRQKEASPRSATFIERLETVIKLLELLGYELRADKVKLDKHTLEENWAKVVSDESVNRKRLNELFGRDKGRRIDQDTKPRQVLTWINQLLAPFGLVIKRDHGKHTLAEGVALLELIQRKT